jgi:hypothetical protein
MVAEVETVAVAAVVEAVVEAEAGMKMMARKGLTAIAALVGKTGRHNRVKVLRPRRRRLAHS